jgi:tRNA dimethylallyltransferase
MNAPAQLVIITGPTGVGKTAVAVELAKTLNTEIVSADSMQVYRHLSIGTAKPAPEELQGVPYHLVDFVEPDHQYNLGEFVRNAEVLLAGLQERGKIPVVCGGTGMYLRGLIYGVFEEASRDPVYRAELSARADKEGLQALHAELMQLDPAASHIMPRDRQRILRALEVLHVTGKAITQLQTQSLDNPRHRALTFVLHRPRAELYGRINARVDEMLRRGLIDEVRNYLELGYPRDNPAVRALGYSEIIAHVEGRLSLQKALEAMRQKSRNYAKRQLTWFRAMPDARFFEIGNRSAREAAADLLLELKAMLGTLP